MATRKMTWQVAKGYTGWVQAGKKWPEHKCAAHYVAKGNAALTACGAMAIRGNQPTRGFAHYKLRWFEIVGPEALSVVGTCRACAKVAAQ